MESAPRGKSNTTVIPMIIPCAISYDWIREGPLDVDELDEVEEEPSLDEEEVVAAEVEEKGFESESSWAWERSNVKER